MIRMPVRPVGQRHGGPGPRDRLPPARSLIRYGQCRTIRVDIGPNTRNQVDFLPAGATFEAGP